MSKTFNVDDVGPPDSDIDLDDLDLEPGLDDTMESTMNGRFGRPQSASKKMVLNNTCNLQWGRKIVELYILNIHRMLLVTF